MDIHADLTGLDKPLAEKLRKSEEILRELGRVVVAFSAGVDSTLLLAMAVRTLGAKNVLAGVGVSESLAARERASAGELAKAMGVELAEIETGEMNNPEYAANPANRCFFCKSDLFSRLIELGKSRGIASVVAGANADDTGDFRPGLQAGVKLGVRNPLLEAGLTKADIRVISRALGLPTADKPAMACLASRIPYGQPITAGKLGRIERAEYVLKDLGFAQCRVRDHDAVARIEVPASDLPAVLERREEIVASIKALGYTFVALDLQGFRSGSMNETLAENSKVEVRSSE